MIKTNKKQETSTNAKVYSVKKRETTSIELPARQGGKQLHVPAHTLRLCAAYNRESVRRTLFENRWTSMHCPTDFETTIPARRNLTVQTGNC